MFQKILLAGLVAASFGSVPLTASAQQRAIIIREAPPPPREEAMPRERRGQEWSPGHWAWRNGQHVWVRGHWVGQRRGQQWVPAAWVQRDGQWMYMAGHWERGGRNRDRDGDGIRNRNDRDRDGDGVRNRNDAAPNNPNRN
jgi:hypothetical protein